MDRRELRKLDKELSKIGGFDEADGPWLPKEPGEPWPPKEPEGPQPHRAKDFLGAVVTLAVIGAILLDLTNVLASRCAAEPNPRTGRGSCSGMAAVAHHAHAAVTLSVAACAALAVIAFIWYMLRGYKTSS
jgi:hypothetical protein